MVAILMEDKFDWNIKDRIIYKFVTNILNIRLRETMRESESKTYGVGVQQGATKLPKPQYTLLVNWGCSPDNVDGLITTAFGIMKAMQDSLPSTENMEKSRETLLRGLETDNEQNSYWLDKLMHSSINGDKLLTKEEISKVIEGVTPEEVQKAARKYFTQDHYLQVVLKPEK
jgi:zinc protease